MADVFSKSKRSQVMSRIRSRGNKNTELALLGIFRAHKITGWRLQVEIRGRGGPPGCPRLQRSVGRNERVKIRIPAFRVRPDFIFPKLKLAIFVDGCFWHGCPLHGTQPKNNAAFWRNKIAGNRSRDRRVNRALRRAGWRVLRIWEHALRRATKENRNEARLLRRIQRVLK